MLAKVGKKDTETVVNALIKHAQKLPHELYRSLTWDRGIEMADHRRFTMAAGLHARSPRGRTMFQLGRNSWLIDAGRIVATSFVGNSDANPHAGVRSMRHQHRNRHR